MLSVSTAWLVPMLALTLSQTAQNDAPAKPAKESAQTKLSSAVYQLREERNSAEAYVQRAKQADATVQADAQKLYADARGKYNAYIETFLDSVRQGSKADLQAPLKTAADAAAKFKTYVDGNSKAMGAGWLVPLGKVIFDAFSTARSEAAKQSKEQRKEMADEWAKTLPWKAWADIK